VCARAGVCAGGRGGGERIRALMRLRTHECVRALWARGHVCASGRKKEWKGGDCEREGLGEKGSSLVEFLLVQGA